MLSAKVKCIYCNKKIVANQEYCPKCGKDIRSMWQSEKSDEDSNIPLYCPNPKCHALYTKGSPFCRLCGNDYKKQPPIHETDFVSEPPEADCVYCPQCGKQNKNNDLFCDCGCDFRTNPRIAVQLRPETVFFCAICGTNRVNMPNDVCDICKLKTERKTGTSSDSIKDAVLSSGKKSDDHLMKKKTKSPRKGFQIATEFQKSDEEEPSLSSDKSKLVLSGVSETITPPSSDTLLISHDFFPSSADDNNHSRWSAADDFD